MHIWHLLFLLDLALGGLAGDTSQSPEGWPENLDAVLELYPWLEKM